MMGEFIAYGIPVLFSIAFLAFMIYIKKIEAE